MGNGHGRNMKGGTTISRKHRFSMIVIEVL